MDIGAGLGVVHRMIGADDAAQRLGQGAIEVSVRLVLQQAIVLHDLVHQDGVLGVAAAELEGVAGGHHGAAIVDGGLNAELLALLVLVSPLRADLFDHAAELVADDGRMLGDVVGHALVCGALDGGLVAGHADGVGDDLHQNLVVLDCGHLKGIQAKVVCGVHAHCFVQHIRIPPSLYSCWFTAFFLLLLYHTMFRIPIIFPKYYNKIRERNKRRPRRRSP